MACWLPAMWILLVMIVLGTHRTTAKSAHRALSESGVGEELVVPNIVHQMYDYQSPNYFAYLSIMTARRFLKPEKHILWVNNEGRFRPGHWSSWQANAREGTWEHDLAQMLKTGKIEAKMVTFPAHPPGNSSINVQNKAHRSDFMRMEALRDHGGIYLDTDVFVLRSLDALRVHDFTLGFDNVVNPDQTAVNAKRLNNGVMLSVPNAKFLQVWSSTYSTFDPTSWDYHSSVVPFNLAVQYPDLVHVEMNRISPVSYGLQTSEAAAALTCGLLLPESRGIWYPITVDNKPTFVNAPLDIYLYKHLNRKYALHMTMSAVRGISMLRKHLGPDDLKKMPSFLGSTFRQAVHADGTDTYDYRQWETRYKVKDTAATDAALAAWEACRAMLGMHTPLEAHQPAKRRPASDRQQYVSSQLPP